MVSTRSHPTPLPAPDASPSKSVAATPSKNARSSRARKGKWSHTPTSLTLVWLIVSLPLVIWDTGYVLLRPHTFPGGALHKPLYVPYDLYGRVDKVYGIEAYEERDGFAGAQGTLNVVETVGYLVYLWVVRQYGVSSRDDTETGWLESGFKTLGFDGAVGGGWGGIACLTGFALSIMTLSKTYLYGKSSLPHISLTCKAFEADWVRHSAQRSILWVRAYWP